MVACKVILAVAVVFLAVIVQIQSRPGAETEYISIIDEVKSITGNIAKVVEDNTANITNITANITTSAKNHLSDFADGIKSEVEAFSKSLEGKFKV